MIISFKTGIVATMAVTVSGGALLALFYFSEGDFGRYGELALGNVRGESTARFALPSDEIIISSRRAGDAVADDVAILTETRDRRSRMVRIVRNSAELVFEQAVSTTFRSVVWDDRGSRFAVESADSAEGFYLVPLENGYTLIPL